MSPSGLVRTRLEILFVFIRQAYRIVDYPPVINSIPVKTIKLTLQLPAQSAEIYAQ
jgi:hypothetical protein